MERPTPVAWRGEGSDLCCLLLGPSSPIRPLRSQFLLFLLFSLLEALPCGLLDPERRSRWPGDAHGEASIDELLQPPSPFFLDACTEHSLPTSHAGPVVSSTMLWSNTLSLVRAAYHLTDTVPCFRPQSRLSTLGMEIGLSWVLGWRGRVWVGRGEGRKGCWRRAGPWTLSAWWWDETGIRKRASSFPAVAWPGIAGLPDPD